MDEDVIASTISSRNQNSRRGQTSITHLMNFTLPPIPQDSRNSTNRESRRRRNSCNRSFHLSSDRARYIHANYRFIVKPNGNYNLQVADADQPLDWSDILQILVSPVSQDSSCPICLSRPIVPRMLTCGHILCLPCLIRYVHSGDINVVIPKKKARWIECPICWDSVNISEMRSVRWYAGQENLPSRDGEEIVLRLVTRKPGKTLALPKELTEGLRNLDDIPWYSSTEIADYAKIMKGGQEYMNDQYTCEIEDIRNLEKENELIYDEGPEWTQKAISEIYEAKKRIQGIGNPPMIYKCLGENKPKKSTTLSQVTEEFIREEPLSTRTSKFCEVEKNAQNSALKSRAREHKDVKNQINEKKDNPKIEKSFFFYHALPHYYLSPLDIRILKSAYGSFDLFPSVLLSRIEHVSNGHIINNEFRKRMKYLSHIPQGCEIKFLECDWTGIIVPEILDQFSNEIEMRRKRNSDKLYREEREKLLAEKAEDDTHWLINKTHNCNDLENFPLEIPKSSLVSSDLLSTEPTCSSSSFAAQSVETTGTRTVWGTMLVASSSKDISTQQKEPDVDDGWLKKWEVELEIEDNLDIQARDLSLNKQGSVKNPGSGKEQKKKKARKITLMSTTAKRAA
ncbi:putative ring finger domain protein [Erysiphe necator]|uniref:Putative ring finger domain protein n=1 Tax=Uncinula necator TaxID=52586 RepID=A0A0B1P079_UNCNE|nr:putative ring finger domain protein [Erysiphe necator]